MKNLFLVMLTVTVLSGCSQAQSREVEAPGVVHRALTDWEDYKFMTIEAEEIYCKEADSVLITVVDLEVYEELSAVCTIGNPNIGNSVGRLDAEDDSPDCEEARLPDSLPGDDLSSVQSCSSGCVKPANMLVMNYGSYSIGCRCDGTVCPTY